MFFFQNINFIIVNFHLNKNYSILMKFGFKGNSLFYKSGKQGLGLGLKISNTKILKLYSHIYNVKIMKIMDVRSK